MGGQLVKIAPGQQNCINPLDIVVDYGSDETDPVLEKTDFILKLCEIITAMPWGLDSVQKTIIDDCIHQLYAPFYDENHILRPISKEEMPTLTDLQNLLAKRREPAYPQQIAWQIYLCSNRRVPSALAGLHMCHGNPEVLETLQKIRRNPDRNHAEHRRPVTVRRGKQDAREQFVSDTAQSC